MQRKALVTPTVPPTSRIRFVFLLGFLIASGCSRVVVNSDPPGATVLYSTNGLAPWRNWPPDEKSASPPSLTPLRTFGFYHDYYFLKVEIPGYQPVKPVLLELNGFHRAKVQFDLTPSPELFAMQQRAKGLVLFNGEWVDPAARGLVEYQGEWVSSDEKFRREQEAKGLVIYEDQWMTPAQRDSAFASAQKAKGLVLFKDRWLTPQEVENQSQIDSRVEELLPASKRTLSAPVVVGRLSENKSQLRILNGTGQVLHFFARGLSSVTETFEPYGSKVLTLIPGNYSAVAYQTKSRDAQSTETVAATELSGLAHAQIELEEGYQYSLTYEGPAILVQDIDEILSSIDKPVQFPTIEIPNIEDFTTSTTAAVTSDKPSSATLPMTSDHPSSTTLPMTFDRPTTSPQPNASATRSSR